MQHVDWYATFCHLAGVDPADKRAKAAGLPPVDSINMWPLLSGENATSPRETLLVSADVLISGDHKLMQGTFNGAAWSGPQYPNTTTSAGGLFGVRQKCEPCLYNVASDPTEHHNVASENPALVAELQKRLAAEAATIWHRKIKPDDPECMKKAWARGGFLGPWLKG